MDNKTAFKLVARLAAVKSNKVEYMQVKTAYKLLRKFEKKAKKTGLQFVKYNDLQGNKTKVDSSALRKAIKYGCKSNTYNTITANLLLHIKELEAKGLDRL